MFRNQYVFFLFLFILHMTLSGCARKFKLKNEETITRKEIIAEVEAYKQADKASNYYRSKNVKISKRLVEKKDDKNPFYKTIKDLEIGKLSNIVTLGKMSIFYVKTGDSIQTYYQPDQINIFQPSIINDDLFNEELDRIINLLERGDIVMSQIKEHLNKDYGISVQYFNNKSFIEEEKLKPEVIDQLKNKEVGSVYKTEKVQVGKVTYLSLIQNVGIKKENPVCHYLSIRLL
jgi:hypothetical protein